MELAKTLLNMDSDLQEIGKMVTGKVWVLSPSVETLNAVSLSELSGII